MKNQNKEIVYIGKAKNLRNRVSSYFNKNIDSESKVGKLVAKINDIDYIVTNNEQEALVLESNLIKKHKPIYNILLKDDKGYKFIKISQGPYSKISVVSRKQKDKSTYIGPYMSGFTANQIVDVINRVFKLPTCNRDMFKQDRYKRPCLNYYINLCSAPCCNYISLDEYNDNINQALEYLKLGMKPVIKNLKNNMIKQSNAMNFEEAAKIRDRIKMLEKLSVTNNVLLSGHKSVDVLTVVEYQNYVCGTILIVRDYKLIDKVQYITSDKFDEIDLKEFRKTVILSYYINNNNLPDAVCLDEIPEDFELIKNYIFKNINIIFENQIKNKNQELKKIIEISRNNSKERILQEIKLIDKEVVNLDKLKKLLNLKKMPRKIEAYDISNFGSQIVVGAMITIIDGNFKKSNYRKFKIKNLDIQDDYASMAQVIERRLNRYKINLELDESKKNASFETLPDLILVDGGHSHVLVVDNVLKNFSLNLPIYGMVKDDKHTTEALIGIKNKKIKIKEDKDVFLFIKRIQDEIHRFTIAYSRKLYNKDIFKS